MVAAQECHQDVVEGFVLPEDHLPELCLQFGEQLPEARRSQGPFAAPARLVAAFDDDDAATEPRQLSGLKSSAGPRPRGT